jgi:hypothetical protein
MRNGVFDLVDGQRDRRIDDLGRESFERKKVILVIKLN